jgi:eukaryotic-like serine/threonine-protein kinase
MSIYNKRLALNNSMIITSIAGVCLVLVIMPLGLVFAQSNSPTLTYKNDAQGFMIQYPADWQNHDGQPGDTIIVTFASPLKDSQDKFTETFNIGIEGLTFPNYPLDQYSESAMGQLKSVFPEFRLEHLDANASLSGYPAYKIDYSYVINTQEGPIKIKNLQVWTISGDNAYILTFGMESSKYSDYAPLIDDIINSFKLVESQTAALIT